MEEDRFLELPIFERALALATLNHAGQVDKAGEPYVMHVIRVMQGVHDHDEKIIALLHDLIEDTTITVEDLMGFGFSQQTIHSVKLLTRDPKEDYMDYIKKLSHDRRARHVKLSDLRDNQDHTRLKNPMTEESQIRLAKYQKAEAFLREVDKNEE